jgi:prepilin-type N-terminal cleavage/methylation domain-containing protein
MLSDGLMEGRRMQEPRGQARQRGFSMIELMVAMVVTLVVSGAIFGLLTAGGNAFRREPEVADRQQNIRIAMDSITRDIENAGSGMPLVSQVFTHTDTPLVAAAANGAGAPYLNGQGPQGVMGAAGMALRGAAPTGVAPDTSDNSDVLELLIADASCPVFRVCAPGGLNGTAVNNVSTLETIPAGGCLLSPAAVGTTGLLLLTDNRLFTIQPATLNANGTGCGAPTAINGSFNLGNALAEWPTAGGVALTPAGGNNALVYAAHVVRYMIAPAIDPLGQDTSPALWRSDTGRYTTAGAASLVPAVGATNWQLIARGIEDLQLEYLNGGNLWSNSPGVVAPCAAGGCTLADYNNVVRRVRVTLSARALAPNLLGQTTPAGGAAPNAVRGQLVSVATPRAAVLGLQAVSSVSGWQ